MKCQLCQTEILDNQSRVTILIGEQVAKVHITCRNVRDQTQQEVDGMKTEISHLKEVLEEARDYGKHMADSVAIANREYDKEFNRTEELVIKLAEARARIVEITEQQRWNNQCNELKEQLAEARVETNEMCKHILEYKQKLFDAQIEILEARQEAVRECVTIIKSQLDTIAAHHILHFILTHFGLEGER